MNSQQNYDQQQIRFGSEQQMKMEPSIGSYSPTFVRKLFYDKFLNLIRLKISMVSLKYPNIRAL